MKIYANNSRVRDLSSFIGKDVWIKMRGCSMKIFYVQLLEALPDERYSVHTVPWVYMLNQKLDFVQACMEAAHDYKICWESEYWGDYTLLVEHPLDLMSTQEILDMAGR